MATKSQLTHLAHMALGASWLVTACSESTDVAATGTPDANPAYPGTIFDSAEANGTATNAAIAADVIQVSPDSAFVCANQSPAPTFCDDFDGPELRDVWDTVTIAYGLPTSKGVFEHNSLDAISPPNSLLVDVVSATDDPDLKNLVTKSFGALSQQAAHFTVEFDLKVESFDHRPERMLAAFQLAFGILTAQSYGQRSLVIVSDGSHVSLRVAELSMSTDETEPVTTLTNAYPEAYWLEQNTWVHVVFESDVTRDAGDLVRLTVAGQQVLERNMTFATHAFDTRIQLGQTWVTTSDGTQEWRVRFDNVLVGATAL
jgi:hypothetical protein